MVDFCKYDPSRFCPSSVCGSIGCQRRPKPGAAVTDRKLGPTPTPSDEREILCAEVNRLRAALTFVRGAARLAEGKPTLYASCISAIEANADAALDEKTSFIRSIEDKTNG